MHLLPKFPATILPAILAAILALPSPAAPAPAAPQPVPVWKMPAIWPLHCQLREQSLAAIRKGDPKALETACRRAIAAMPTDPTWNYNLACALAYGPQPGLALTQLEKAIALGFRDASAIANDQDLKRISRYPRFRELIAKARRLADTPPPHAIPVSPLQTSAGSPATLTASNLVWNFETGLIDALLSIPQPDTPPSALASVFLASTPAAPERSIVQSWLNDGSAAGNASDLYLNRDDAHSQLKLSDFPLLTPVLCDAEGRSFQAHLDHPTTAFPQNFAVFGNVSRARVSGHLWRSMPRASMTDPALALRMDALYRNNQFWVFVAHKDFGVEGIGDVFPGNAPFQFVAIGSSWSDQPFLRAALAASASLRPLAKTAILRRRLMGPTLQWLFRSTRPGVSSASDYLSPKAHPTAFAKTDLDVPRLVEKAHSLRPETIPPAVQLIPVNSTRFPIPQPVPERDYSDSLPEFVYATPSAIAYALRTPLAKRQFLFRAVTSPERDDSATFAWAVVNGNPAAVKITPPTGEPLETPERGFAEITIDRSKMSSRIDVACFAKSSTTDFGAPSIISFYPLPIENRSYNPDGSTRSIDYSNPSNLYCDPILAFPRRWKDTYSYSPDGHVTGFTRTSSDGKNSASFIAHNVRITARDPSGKPTKAIAVKYVPRKTGNPVTPVELTYVDDGEPFDL